MNFAPPTIAWRGKVARLLAEVQQHRPKHGEAGGTIRCICGGSVRFNIQASGVSRGHCSSGCGVRWCH